MNTKKLVQTALFLSITLLFQIGLGPFSQAMVGPAVNMMLIISTLLIGPSYAVIIGTLTPIVALMVGIIKLPVLIPIIVIGNALIIVVFSLSKDKDIYSKIAFLVAASIAKFSFLALGARYILKLFLPNVPPAIIVTFTWPQLTNALIGGSIALAIYMALPKNIK
ncbi:MAG: ECF transporter S component [Clostridiales bacterium]|nr:ECF transporter S component [Clostridiales bacterium]